MRKFTVQIALATFVVAVATCVLAQNRISPSEAAGYVGKKATVCGQVASATFAVIRDKGQALYYNI
jgi:hypothetical protein